MRIFFGIVGFMLQNTLCPKIPEGNVVPLSINAFLEAKILDFIVSNNDLSFRIIYSAHQINNTFLTMKLKTYLVK